MMITINAGAATLGTPIFGYIVDRTGSYPIAGQVLAAAIAVGMLAMATLLNDTCPQALARQGFPSRLLDIDARVFRLMSARHAETGRQRREVGLHILDAGNRFDVGDDLPRGNPFRHSPTDKNITVIDLTSTRT